MSFQLAADSQKNSNLLRSREARSSEAFRLFLTLHYASGFHILSQGAVSHSSFCNSRLIIHGFISNPFSSVQGTNSISLCIYQKAILLKSTIPLHIAKSSFLGDNTRQVNCQTAKERFKSLHYCRNDMFLSKHCIFCFILSGALWIMLQDKNNNNL